MKYQKMRKRIVKLKKENSICEKVTESQNPSKENTFQHGQGSNKIGKKENNINKQLTEIRHNKYKDYLESKSLERNKN